MCIRDRLSYSSSFAVGKRLRIADLHSRICLPITGSNLAIKPFSCCSGVSGMHHVSLFACHKRLCPEETPPMKRNVLIRSILVLLSLALFGLTAYLSSKRVSAQSADAQSRVYFPYPPGLIPSDLPKEAKRVEGEVDALEREAFAQWKALPLNPGTAKRQVELLGKLELFDRNLSVNKNEACSFCHMPYTGFSGPISSVNATVVAYPGSARWRFGKRKPQGYTYSPLYPTLQYNQTLANFYGGNFWDLRATGYRTQSPDAEQAQGPPHDTQEMGLPDTACVVYRIAKGK